MPRSSVSTVDFSQSTHHADQPSIESPKRRLTRCPRSDAGISSALRISSQSGAATKPCTHTREETREASRAIPAPVRKRTSKTSVSTSHAVPPKYIPVRQWLSATACASLSGGSPQSGLPAVLQQECTR
jgi:hypothetical protein